jgi:PTS system galactitol-specific IIC component
VAAITHSIPLALAAAAIEVVLELKNADLVQKSVCRLSKISNVTCPHVMNLQGVILAPISRLLDFIPGINKINLDSNKLKEKIGIFGENSVMGFIVGVLIAAIGRCSVKVILQTGVEIATALVLFPLVANLFLESLGPIAEAAGEYMKKKYKGREFCIGIDWSVLGGSSELWVTSILLVPVELVFAIILAKFGINSVLPLAAIINVAATVPALIVTGGNIIKMFIMGVITTPIYLLVSSEFAPILTNLARVQKTLTIPQGQFLTYYGIEGPEFRWTIAHAANIINGDIIGLALFICFIGLFFWYAKYMKRRDREMEVMEKKDIKIENVK